MFKKLLFTLALLCSIYVYSTDIAYINSDTRKQVKASGAAITQSDYLTLPYYANPEITLNIVDSNGTAVDLSDLYSAYNFIVMDSYKSGIVVVRTTDTDINKDEADSGRLIVDTNTSTSELQTALNDKSSILGVGALLCFASTDLVHPQAVYPLQVILESIPDMTQAPTGSTSLYYTSAEIDALLAEAGIGLNIDDVKADTDIADAITKKHAHSNSVALALVSGTNTGDQVIPDQLSDLTADSTHRTVTDTEKSTWNGKQDAGTYSTDIHSNISALNAVSGTNTGDNATNSQYSGLATSKADALVTINDQADSYTLVASDASKLVRVNKSTANTVTIPPSEFTLGTCIAIEQLGAGATTITAGSGVVLNSANGLILNKQYSIASIMKTAETDTWLLCGDLKSN